MDGVPEERLHDQEGVAKFRDLDELSDDSEKDMEISSRSSGSESGEPSRKRVKTTAADDGAQASAPKWSNPDPYTALPPPDETQQKKRDVVALIRKARNDEAAAANKADGPSAAADFIAFDSSSDSDDDETHPGDAHINLPPPPPPPSQPPPPLPSKPPPPPPSAEPASRANLQNGTTSSSSLQSSDNPLGSRKRMADDTIKPPDYGIGKKGGMKPSDGRVHEDWAPKPDDPRPTPWATTSHEDTKSASLR